MKSEQYWGVETHAVSVDPLHVVTRAGLLYRIGRQDTEPSGHREDDVGSLASSVWVNGLAQGGVGEVLVKTPDPCVTDRARRAPVSVSSRAPSREPY